MGEKKRKSSSSPLNPSNAQLKRQANHEEQNRASEFERLAARCPNPELERSCESNPKLLGRCARCGFNHEREQAFAFAHLMYPNTRMTLAQQDNVFSGGQYSAKFMAILIDGEGDEKDEVIGLWESVAARSFLDINQFDYDAFYQFRDNDISSWVDRGVRCFPGLSLRDSGTVRLNLEMMMKKSDSRRNYAPRLLGIVARGKGTPRPVQQVMATIGAADPPRTSTKQIQNWAATYETEIVEYLLRLWLPVEGVDSKGRLVRGAHLKKLLDSSMAGPMLRYGMSAAKDNFQELYGAHLVLHGPKAREQGNFTKVTDMSIKMAENSTKASIEDVSSDDKTPLICFHLKTAVLKAALRRVTEVPATYGQKQMNEISAGEV